MMGVGEAIWAWYILDFTSELQMSIYFHLIWIYNATEMKIFYIFEKVLVKKFLSYFVFYVLLEDNMKDICFWICTPKVK